MATSLMGADKALPPFRAEHIGSLLRPAKLLEARRAAGFGGIGEPRRQGSISLDALRAVEDDCIAEAVRFQEQVGLASITDGEFRRASWAVDIAAAIEGVNIRIPHSYGQDFKGSGFTPPVPHTDGRLKRPARGLVTEDFAYIKKLTHRTPKATLPSPTILHYRGGRKAVSSIVYPDIEEFFADLVQVYVDELQALAREGCRYVQLDEVHVAVLCDPAIRELKRSEGEEPDALVERYGRLVSEVARRRPAGMFIGMHMCRGNARGHWLAEGGYDPVAERLFSEFAVDAFFMEYDTPRAGDFGPLRYAPKDKKVVLGLVSTKTAELESADTLKRRIEEASRFVPIENLCLSPQCGFASAFEGNPVSVDDQRRKLDLVVRVAEQIWGRQ